jgi:MoxR-like ATPase
MDRNNNTEYWKAFELIVIEEGNLLDSLLASLRQTIVGQETLLETLVIALLGNGHVLLEGMPGLAKTLAVKTLANAVNAAFSRIQFTPDLLPADILGTMIYNIQTNEFSIKKGPVFSNFVLADEINRASEKVQSALLEVMQEHQVTIGNTTYKLDAPFMVLATQNPIDQSGTYELPEAQMDRFMLKVIITYPLREEEREVLRKNIQQQVFEHVLTINQVVRMQELVKQVYLDKKIEDYILDLVICTRTPGQFGLTGLQSYIKFGSSPRGTINLAMAARAHAFLKKRNYVIPADVYAVASDVLRHRIGLTYTAVAENITADNVLQQILAAIHIP